MAASRAPRECDRARSMVSAVESRVAIMVRGAYGGRTRWSTLARPVPEDVPFHPPLITATPSIDSGLAHRHDVASTPSHVVTLWFPGVVGSRSASLAAW